MATNEVADVSEAWYSGTIIRQPGTDYWFAALSNGTEVFIFQKAVVRNGSHYCMQVGDEVALRVTLADKGWCAVECQIQYPRQFSEPEYGVVEKAYDSRERFFIRRDCGCSLYVALGKPMDFQVGDRVAALHIVPGRNGKGYVALRLESVEEEQGE